MRRFHAIFIKEFRQIRRDPLSLGLLILVPVMLVVLYGYALSFDVKHIATAVLDYDQTPESRQLLDSMFQNPYFARKMELSQNFQAGAALDQGRVRAVVVIPRGYAKGLSRGETASVQVLVDGADATTASTTVGYVEALTDRMTRQLRQSSVSSEVPALPTVITEPRFWFNPEIESAHFLVPGLIGMLLMLSAVVATSLSLVRERERETIEQMMVSPVKPYELVLGKTLPYVVISLGTLALILLLGFLLFGIVVQGSWLLLTISTLLFLFAALGMGMLISSITRSQQVAFQVATFSTLLPSIILSGLIFPIQNMPLPIQTLTLLVVPRHFVTVLRGIILKGAGLDALWPSLLAMLLLGLGFNLLAVRNTKKTV